MTIKKAKPEPKPERCWWMRGDPVVQLWTHLNGVGTNARVEVHLDDDDKLTIHVIPESDGPTEAGGVTHVEHLCPPEHP